MNVLRHPDLDDNDIRKDCWREMTILACDNDADIVLSVIQILSIIKGEEQAKSQLLIECVSQNHFNANLVQVIGHTFFEFKDPDLVDVKGNMSYNVIMQGIGTIYKQEFKFRMKFNNITGEFISISRF